MSVCLSAFLAEGEIRILRQASMQPPLNKPESNGGKKSDQLNVFYALSLAWQMGFLIIAPILLFLFGGYMIDKWLKTAPLFIIISIFAALAVSVYEIHHLIKPMLESSRKELEEITGEKSDSNKK
ncbi:AtpZ/AtpI family protein [Patescibacteria group bacterium]|nr:MAG: AtpZ/AtpI family protein [Patescibacteria group bacterium]